jgi:hypothetical protein
MSDETESDAVLIDRLSGRISRISTKRDELERERDRLRELLREWDSLIKYQYSGSREAMSALAAVAQKTVAALGGEKS